MRLRERPWPPHRYLAAGLLAVLALMAASADPPATDSNVPMRTEEVLIIRKHVFYLLEYRANARSFPRHLAAFDRAVATFRLNERD